MPDVSINEVKNLSTYDDSSIKVLSDIDHIQQRPLMYINAETPTLQMFEEIFSNSLDEVLNDYADEIQITIDYETGTITIKDNGRGLPQGINETLQKPTIEVIYSKLNSGGKYDTESYTVSGGLHGVGSCVVNALSHSLYVLTYRDRYFTEIHFVNGYRQSYTEPKLDAHYKGMSGTEVTFIINTDNPIFENDNLKLHEQDILTRLTLVSTLYPKLRLVYNGEVIRGGSLSKFLPVAEYVLPKPIEYSSKTIKLSVNWTTSLRSGSYDSYCNMIHTSAGGDHIYAVEDAVLGVFSQNKDALLGMNLILSATYSSVSYTSQSKDRAKSQAMRTAITTELKYYLSQYFKNNPEERDKLLRLFQTKRNDLDKRAGKKTTSKKDRRANFLASLDQGGFADCTTRDRSLAELTICEGLSAAGSLKQARDPQTQAVMPLRGKFINAYNCDMKSILSNREAATIIQSLGSGIFDEVDVSKSRYSKVIIFSDSDEDGKDIACQLIAFFSKVLPQFLLEGMLYLAIPPLYGTTVNGQFIPIHTEEDKEYHLKKGHYVQRYKGLGEMMPEQLRVTSLNPETRRLIQLKVDESTFSIVEKIMGGDSSNRKSLLIEMGVFEEWQKA